MRAEFAEGEAELAGMREQRRGRKRARTSGLASATSGINYQAVRQASLRPPSTAWLGTAVTEKKSQVVRGRFRASLNNKKRHMWCCAPLRQ